MPDSDASSAFMRAVMELNVIFVPCLLSRLIPISTEEDEMGIFIGCSSQVSTFTMRIVNVARLAGGAFEILFVNATNRSGAACCSHRV